MKISASIYSSRDKDLTALVQELDAYNVDFFHIDCNEDPSVFDDIRTIREHSKIPIDLHLITKSPEKYWDLIHETGVELVTLQYETLVKKLEIPKHINAQLGLSLVSSTPLDVFKDFNGIFSFVLFMTTVPGKSGGSFNRETFRRIRQFRAENPGKNIHVDGGINAEVSFILRNMGVYAAVIGSYLFRNDFIGSAVMNLRSDDIESPYRVKDFMLQTDEIPILQSAHLGFPDVLQSIEDFRMGFTMVASLDGRLEGIISNADVRRGLLKNISSLDKIDVSGMINRNPAFVCEDDTVSEMLNYIKNLPFPVLFLPVVDKEKRIKGTIKFNNLIKGES
jgi:ribulose-phosphate 3-epimerase